VTRAWFVLLVAILVGCADAVEAQRGFNERKLLQYKACTDKGGIPAENGWGQFECRSSAVKP